MSSKKGASPEFPLSPEAYRDNLGRWRTKSLFIETAPGLSDGSHVIFRFKDNGYNLEYPCLKDYYIALEDPTEYRIATEVLGGWAHWLILTKCAWFEEHIALWREELAVKLVSKGVRSMIDQAVGGSIPAAKFLVQNSWTDTDAGKRKRGRPTKVERDGFLRALVLEDDDISDDLARIKGTIN